MTPIEPSLLDSLQASRRAVKVAVTGVKDPLGASRSGDGWSIIDCLEHLAIVDERFVARVKDAGREGAPPRDAAREGRLVAAASDRGKKIEAPGAVRPTGNFTSVKAALDAFATARDRTLDLVRAMGDSLYDVKAEHPIMGVLNGVELARTLDGHTMRHVAQIQELRAALGG